jgi:type IV pilus assembly protein PilO
MAMTFEEFKQIDFRDPGRWPLALRLGVIGLFFVVVATVLLIFLVWNANKDELASLENKEQQLRTEFRTKHGKAVNLELYQQQLADIQKQFGTQVRQLPGKTEMDNLLVDISQSGTQTGLEVTQFDPQPEQNRDFYAERPIKIRLTGSYHQMGEFASAIAALPRIVTLHDVNIRGASNKSSGTDQLVMNVTAKTYRYLDESEIAAANAARKKQGAARK